MTIRGFLIFLLVIVALVAEGTASLQEGNAV
jgi:hypothetical protein